MKKFILTLLFAVTLTASIFAAPKSKAKSFTFDFSKDFYPGIGYVCLNGSCFKDAYFVKADVAKGDKIKISGLIKDFSKNPYLLDYLSFTVVDSE